MNKQELFQQSVTKLFNQGKPSIRNDIRNLDGGPACAYRGGNGLKCAIGHLIPDENYDQKMEAKSIDALLKEWPILADLFKITSSEDQDFLFKLQKELHDYIANDNDFKKSLLISARKLATDWNLDDKFMQKLENAV